MKTQHVNILSDEGTIPSVNRRFEWELYQSIELDELITVVINVSPDRSFFIEFV